MTWKAARVALLFAVVPACGGEPCPRVVRAPPMTEARARELDPRVAEGLAVSTTHVYGDCRSTREGGLCPGDRCREVRAPLHVVAVAANQSVPLSPRCPGGHLMEDLAPRAAGEGRASAEGELVLALTRGVYSLHLSWNGECAGCGLEGGGSLCLIEVPPGRVAARDLVLDRSAR